MPLDGEPGEESTATTPVAPPAISEVGNGAYKFTPVFPTDKGLVWVINGGAGSHPRYQAGFNRPEDYSGDLLQDMSDQMFGEMRLVTTGPDANRLVLYRPDSSVLLKFDLLDADNVPTFSAPFRRIPV